MVAFLIFIFLFGYFQQSASTDAITDYQPNKVNVIVRRVLGGILIALGIFGVITSIILFSLRSGGILPDDSSDLDIQLGFFMFSIVSVSLLYLSLCTSTRYLFIMNMRTGFI